jgi:hypothetical protein
MKSYPTKEKPSAWTPHSHQRKAQSKVSLPDNRKSSHSGLVQMANQGKKALQLKVLESLFNSSQPIQKQGLEEEDLLQGKFDSIQKQEMEEEELIQGKFDTVQKMSLEEEEPLQGKFESAQREEIKDKELLQGKFETVQKMSLEEEEPLQGKFETTQLVGMEEEDLLQGKFETVQKQKINTGLPDNLKSGIENLSGYSMDDVKVHYNSDKPATLQAHAYAQGTEIHIATGQEKHLPHEAWHVVQQKQGRVKPTIQLRNKVNVNDDPGLEKEADVMGGRAKNIGNNGQQILMLPDKDINEKGDLINVSNGVSSIQRAIGMEIESQNLNMWTGDGPYSAAKAVPYGTLVLETPRGFDVEADDAGRVEFVTKAFPEEGGDLLRAVSAAAEFAKSAVQKTKEHKALNGNTFATISSIGAGTLTSPKDPSVELIYADDIYAKPQVTLGMPLDKFIAVLKKIGENTKEYPATAFHKIGPEMGLHHEKRSVEDYWDGESRGSGGEMESTYQSIVQRNHFSAKQSALIALFLQYITEANCSGLDKKSAMRYADLRSKASEGDLDDLFQKLNSKDSTRWTDSDQFPTPYPKAEHPLMARTNFRKMLEMAQFKVDDLKDLKVDILGLAGLDEDNLLYPLGYYSDAVKDEELYKPASIDKIESGPTVGQWLDSIFLPAPQDANPAKKSSIAAMGNRVAPHLPGTPENRGLGAMGAKTEQINIPGQADPEEAPIFEYRLLNGVYAPDEWVPLSMAILNAARVVYGHEEAELPN